MKIDLKIYKNIASFHKYWGKKPIEFLIYLVQVLSKQDDWVMDPFLGMGLIVPEIIKINRKFVGIDVNPFSIDYTKFLLNLPKKKDFEDSLKILENNVKKEINESYYTDNNFFASHYIWDDKSLKKVWYKNYNKKYEKIPTNIDFENFNRYEDYSCKFIRNMNFFDNSRINTKKEYDIKNFFTGRALRNIELIIYSINLIKNKKIKNAFMFCLTSSVSQMSKLVFVINNRKDSIHKEEVGSWAIGYWLPKKHFEINVWNCFINKAKKLLKDLPFEETNFLVNKKYSSKNEGNVCLINNDAIKELKKINDNSISLILTDPPHGDRVPYLELSELWNSILNNKVYFEKEIVVSNAKNRNMDINYFNEKMNIFMYEAIRIVKPRGYIVIMHNSTNKKEWEYLSKKWNNLNYLGCVPCRYSANSLVQRNRKGSLNFDYALIYKKNDNLIPDKLKELDSWTSSFPKS